MKTFSELLDTNIELPVWLMLEPVIANGPPYVKVYINGKLLHCAHMIEGTIIMSKVPLLEPVDIRIEMSGKQYSEQFETAVIVREFAIDDVNIVPDYLHCIDYQNDHNKNVTAAYLGFNGVWTFATTEPFYRWLHRESGQGWLLEP